MSRGPPVAPSAIRAKGKTFVNGTFTEISEPRALALEEIPGIIDSFKRATAGLLITEASQVSQQGQGYQDTPGIYSKEQVAGWRKVTDRVHERGGRIFIQAWHVGRISHISLQPDNGAPVAPSMRWM